MSPAISCHCEAAGRRSTATERLEEALSVLRAASVEAQGCESVVARDLSAAHALGALALERLRRAQSHPAAKPCERRAAQASQVLTPGEWRVATLVAAGLTNRQVSHALFVTAKAVQWHLGNIYRKLEIGSREEIAGFVPAAEEAA
jgi:ATP/maltotriose-dependent transcriptional regulator MalT